jgi:hypothetical protein
MSWIVSLLAAVLCGAAGLVLAGFIANACVTWYHISSFEGGSGYFVVFMAMFGGMVGFVTGIVANRVVAARGGQAAAGILIPLGVVAALASLVTLFAWLAGDVPPRLRGDRVNLVLEVRAPDGWKPSNRIRAGSNWVTLSSIGTGGARRHSMGDPIDWAAARNEGGTWIIPAETRVFTTTGQRLVTITLGGDDVASFLVPLPARPGSKHEEWSDWLPREDDDSTAGSGFSYRFRVRLAGEESREHETARVTRMAEERRRFEALTAESPLEEWVYFLESRGDSSWQSRAGDVVRSRPGELVALVASSDPEVSAGAIRGLGWIFPRPEGTESALRVALAHIQTQLRTWSVAIDPDDPDTTGVNAIKERYVHWMSGWEMLRSDYPAPTPPELLELRDDLAAILETPGLRGTTELDSLESLVRHNIEDWSETEAPTP